MILNALVERLKRRSKDDFKGRHFEATLILQAVSWYLRYPLSYRDIEELFLERGLEVDHSTLNRWVLAYAGPVANSSLGRRMGWIDPGFHTLLTSGRPKQSASSRFCSNTVHAPATPKPLRSHSMASKP